MRVLLYSGAEKAREEALKKTVSESLPSLDISIVDSIKHLSQKLCRPLHGISMAVLIPGTPGELKQILSFKQCFDNVRIILVLPHREGYLQTAIKLNPCYISYGDNNFKNITDILRKVFYRKNRQNSCESVMWYSGSHMEP